MGIGVRYFGRFGTIGTRVKHATPLPFSELYAKDQIRVATSVSVVQDTHIRADETLSPRETYFPVEDRSAYRNHSHELRR